MGNISPLFAVKADKLLDQGHIDDAIRMIEEGLVEFPDYPAAKAVLAKAYKIKGDDSKATELINDALESQPFSKTVIAVRENLDSLEFSKSIESIVEKSQTINFEALDINNLEIVQSEGDLIIEEESSIDFINNFEIEDIEEVESLHYRTEPDDDAIAIQELPSIPMISLLDKNPNFNIFAGDVYLYMPRDFNPFDYNFAKVTKDSIIDWDLNFNSHNLSSKDDFFGLAQKLVGAKIKPIIEETKNSFVGKPPIVTETIANIYVQQGAYKQAADAFEILMAKNPDKKEYFKNKIDEIKTLI